MSDKTEGDSAHEGSAASDDALEAALAKGTEGYDEAEATTVLEAGSDAGEEGVTEDSIEGGEESSETAKADSDSVAGEGEEGAGDQAEKLIAPQHWPEKDRELFGKQSRESQEYLLRREREYTEGINRKSAEVAEVRKALEPIDMQLRQNGTTPGAAVAQLVAWHQALQQNPKDALPKLAKLYGVDLSALSDGAALEYVDPAVQALQQQVQQLTAHIQTTQTNSQQQQFQAVQNEISTFATATDESGNLKHPYFDRVRGYMGALFSSSPDMTLEKAYEAAVFADPELRQAKLASEREAERKAAEKARLEAVDKAKKAGQPIKGAGLTSARKTKPTLDQAINASLAEFGA